MTVRPHPVQSAMRNTLSASDRAHQQVSELEGVGGSRLGVFWLSTTTIPLTGHHLPGVLRHSNPVSCAPSTGAGAEETAVVGCVHTKTIGEPFDVTPTQRYSPHPSHPLHPFPCSCSPIRCCRPCATRLASRSEHTSKSVSCRSCAAPIWCMLLFRLVHCILCATTRRACSATPNTCCTHPAKPFGPKKAVARHTYTQKQVVTIVIMHAHTFATLTSHAPSAQPHDRAASSDAPYHAQHSERAGAHASATW